ncbi:glycosyltransferase family 4 protein [Aestuariimicrobium sp. T2.26MG-19.2B]|uniref:glycosyltransferase family 4 protein n=1 Tax=Aestuariimicrobium sp. T2.26MG-19.2B TaxID=3040679 RepID=UPI0024775AFB|nr:glycosyltransferase family 4 protein [Aestuariimicrobium sp. T2.26MG-19.2B]CAI9402966.1 Glycogen synthase [Aestuariimicrobium sp. T2.26MG-19.2B]
MRIVHLSTVHHDWDNRIVNKECRALAEAGHEVHLVISADEDRVTHGVHVHAIQRRSRARRLLGSQWEGWRKVAELKPDLVHIHDPELIPMGVTFARTRGVPLIYDAHEDLVKQLTTKPWLGPRTARLINPVARQLLHLADANCAAIVTATDDIAASFSPTRGGRDRPVVTVRNLPWGRDFTVVDVARNPRTAVYTGDLTQERGASLMVHAIEQTPEATLVLAGRLLVPESEIERPQVDYRGLVPPSELPGIIAGARVGLIFLKRLPNYENSIPTKVFEYMASGVPFLATDFASWKQLFGGCEGGVFVDSDDPEAVVRELRSLLDDPERCAELGRRGRRAVEQEFSFEAEATKLVGLVETLG